VTARPVRRSMSGARAALVAACGRAAPVSVTRVGGRATITGVGFVASQPRPTGASSNGVELSPVLGFQMKQCLLGAG